MWRELARAAGGIALLPLRVSDYVLNRDQLQRELLADLGGFALEPSAAEPVELPARSLRLFVSCAEASGELHAVNLVHALRARASAAGAPEPEILGFGGERLAAAGVQILGDPVARSVMGFDGVFGSLPFYLGLIRTLAETCRGERVDLFLPLDSPALHVPMAHVAKRYGAPTLHYITPQYWGWAPWRVAGYRKAVDRALTILSFERDWFARRGVDARHVGHPLLDQLARVAPGPEIAQRHTLCLLPGSREGVIERNLPWMLDVVRLLRHGEQALGEGLGPELDVAVVQGDERHRARLERIVAEHGEAVRIECGDLHGSLCSARSALSVSGTILIDLLHHRLPTVVVYRVKRSLEVWLSRHLLSTPWFASVNLIAAEELLPEFAFAGRGPLEEVARALVRCHRDAAWRARCADGLERVARRLGPAGAADRAASHALSLAAERIVSGS